MIWTRNKDEGTLAYRSYQQKDEIEVIGDIRSTISLKSLTCIPTFKGYSFEELKLIDYNYTNKMKGINKVFGINPPENLSSDCNANGINNSGSNGLSNQYTSHFASTNSGNPIHNNSVNPFNSQYPSNTSTNHSSNQFNNSTPSSNNGSNNPFAYSNNSNLNTNLSQNNTANNMNTPFNGNPFEYYHKISNTPNMNIPISTSNPFINQTNCPPFSSENPFAPKLTNNNAFNQFDNPNIKYATPSNHSQSTNPFNNTSCTNPLNNLNANPFTANNYPQNTVTNPFNSNTNPFLINNTTTNPFTRTPQIPISSFNPFLSPISSASYNPFCSSTSTNSNKASAPQKENSDFDKHINQMHDIYSSMKMFNPPSFYYPFQNNHPQTFLSNPFSEVNNLHGHSNLSNSDKNNLKINSKLKKKDDDDNDSSSAFNMKKIENYLQAILKKQDSNKDSNNEILHQNDADILLKKEPKSKGKSKIFRNIKLHQFDQSPVSWISFNDNKTSLRDIKAFIMKKMLQKNQTLFFFYVDDVLLYKNKDKTPLENMSDIMDDSIWFEIKRKESQGVSIDVSPNGLSQHQEMQNSNEEYDEEEDDDDHSYLPIITTLSTQPSMEEIEKMSKQQLTHLSNFSIFNDNGRINFLAPVDITYLNIDNIVTIDPFRVNFYSNEVPPQAGTKINQKAQIELYNLIGGADDNECEEEENKYSSTEETNIFDSIKSYLKNKGGIFVSFSNGILKFRLDSLSS